MNPPEIILGVGEILWDLLPAGKVLGGAPANFAYHASAAGARGIPVSAIGRDALGQELLDSLARLGLDTSALAVDKLHPTGTVTVTIDDRGQPRYQIDEHVAWDFVPVSEVLIDLARQARAICFGTLAQRSPVTRTAIRTMLEAADQKACLRVFDINLRQHFYDGDTIRESLTRADILKLNDEELPVVARILRAPHGSELETSRWLVQAFDLQMVALTRGGRGSLLVTPSAVSEHPGYPTIVTDTVGAGDAFTARLIVGVLRAETLDTLHDRANRLASYVCTQAGATPPIPRDLQG